MLAAGLKDVEGTPENLLSGGVLSVLGQRRGVAATTGDDRSQGLGPWNTRVARCAPVIKLLRHEQLKVPGKLLLTCDASCPGLELFLVRGFRRGVIGDLEQTLEVGLPVGVNEEGPVGVSIGRWLRGFPFFFCSFFVLFSNWRSAQGKGMKRASQTETDNVALHVYSLALAQRAGVPAHPDVPLHAQPSRSSSSLSASVSRQTQHALVLAVVPVDVPVWTSVSRDRLTEIDAVSPTGAASSTVTRPVVQVIRG